MTYETSHNPSNGAVAFFACMDITVYFIILDAIFFLLCIFLAGYVAVLERQMHTERTALSNERHRLQDQITLILEATAKERKDLYDRIQAGTLPQYKEHTDAVNEVETAADDEIVSLEDAKDELMNTDG